MNAISAEPLRCETLRKILEEKGMTQTELALISGVHSNQISAFIGGHKFPWVKARNQIAKALRRKPENVFPEYLIPASTLKANREKIELSRYQLSLLSNIEAKKIKKIELGYERPSSWEMNRLAEIFGKNTSDIFPEYSTEDALQPA